MDPLSNNDYELLYMIYQKDEHSLRLFVEKYMVLIHDAIFFYFNVETNNVKSDELLQEGLYLLYGAIYAYRSDRNATFATFFHRILQNRLTNCYRKLSTYEGGCVRTMLSLDHMVNEYGVPLLETIPNRDITLEGIHYLYVSSVKAVVKEMCKDMYPLECEIIGMRVAGDSYREIADSLSIDEKKVDNVLRKVRKLKGLIDSV